MPKMKMEILASEASSEAKQYADAGLKRAQERKKANDDADFYAVVVFQSKEQRDAFFRAMKLNLDWSNYVDGRKMAERCGVNLPPAVAPAVVAVPDEVWDECATGEEKPEG